MAAPSFFTDKDGRIVLFQPPNPPLYGWLVFRIAALVFRDGTAHDGLSFLATASLFTWAYLEVTSGASPFRRALGGGAIATIVVGAFT